MLTAQRRLHLRVATYNIHKCRGLDRRTRPARIVEVLRELDADVIALQEVLSRQDNRIEEDHARFIAAQLGLHYRSGHNRKIGDGLYGNVLLSRFPLRAVCNYDISTRGREPRGCLRVDASMPGGALLHIFNVHLGTALRERRKQARILVSPDVLNRPDLTGPRIVLGDFNEWTRGLATRLLRAHFVAADLHQYPKRSRTYPGLLPFLHLDHIYFDPALRLHHLRLHRTRRTLVASDHLPLVAELSLEVPVAGEPLLRPDAGFHSHQLAPIQ
jgi:endonuclease/exonuclease/phosphatase family metal-dependent hydrolase